MFRCGATVQAWMGSRVELYAGIRRDARVAGLSIRELARRHGVHRRTVRQALTAAEPPPRRSPARVAPRLHRFKKAAIDAPPRTYFLGAPTPSRPTPVRRHRLSNHLQRRHHRNRHQRGCCRTTSPGTPAFAATARSGSLRSPKRSTIGPGRRSTGLPLTPPSTGHASNTASTYCTQADMQD